MFVTSKYKGKQSNKTRLLTKAFIIFKDFLVKLLKGRKSKEGQTIERKKIKRRTASCISLMISSHNLPV